MLNGITAQFLLRCCFKVSVRGVEKEVAGWWSNLDTRFLLMQQPVEFGATVIGTVPTEEKDAQTKEDSCHHTILYKEEDFVARVNEITPGKGVEVVHDSVGKDNFEVSLACL